MYFILTLLTMLTVILNFILYRLITDVFWESRYANLLRVRISKEIRTMFITILRDVFAHLETLCEPDGDEDFEPYLDSPLRTCPPCEYLLSPPKEHNALHEDANNNYDNQPPPRQPPRARRGRGRGRLPAVLRLPGALRLPLEPPRSPPLLRQNLQLRIVPIDQLPELVGEQGIPQNHGPLPMNEFRMLFRQRQRDFEAAQQQQEPPPSP